MFKVKLFTSDGHYVVTGLLPPFQVLPEVVMWGDRVFKLEGNPRLSERPQLESPIEGHPTIAEGILRTDITYREVFATVILQTTEEKE